MAKRTAVLAIIISSLVLAVAPLLLADPKPEAVDRYPFEQLKLTPTEQAWVDAHPVIRISGPKSFPPFNFFEPDGTLKGMSFDYIMTLTGMLGIRVEIQRNLPWYEVLERMRNKDLDVITCLSYTRERASYISFSDPYLSFPMVIITRKDYDFISDQKDLNNHRIACIKGVVTCEWLERDGIKFKPHLVTTQPEALESVSLGKADMFVGNLAAITYQIERKGLANLKVAAPTNYGNYKLYLGVRKDWPDLTALFNRALKQLPPESHTAFKDRWMKVKYDYGFHLSDVLRWGIVGMIISVLVLAGFIAWNRRLSHEIEEKDRISTSLKQDSDFNRAVLRWVHSIVMVLDRKGYIVLFNNAAETCSGYTFEEVQDAPYWEILLPPDEAAAIKERTESVSTKALTTGSVNHWITRFGNKRLIQWLYSPLMGTSGGVEHVLCTGLDITEQKKAETASSEDRQKLTHALASTGASIWEWNLKTGEIDIGDEIIHQLGYEKQDLTLTPEGMSQIVSEESVEAFAGLAVHHTVDDTQTRIIEVRVRAKGGDWHWMRSRTRVYRWDSENQPEVLLGSLVDITEAKRTQDVIIQTEKMMSVGGLAAGMAHELNNPLGAMLMGLQNVQRWMSPEHKKNLPVARKTGIDLNLLQDYLQEQKIPAAFEGIRKAGLRAADIISNMLQFSRSGDYRYETVEMSQLLDDTLKLAENNFNLKKQVDFKQVNIIREFDPDLPPVSCVESEIRQVVLNLILNAFQAMSDTAAGQPLELRLKTGRDVTCAVIEIEDNGPGMNESVRKRIFEPFYTTKLKGEGTGLGLSVAYMIITSHHLGEIDVDSTPGEGTRFTIKLPFNSPMES